jgi:hypothetical protein
MANWSQRIQDHQAFSKLRELEDLLSQIEIKPGEPTDVTEDVERLRQIVRYTRSALQGQDPALIPLPLANAIQQQIQPPLNEIAAFVRDRNRNHLTNANTQIDTLLQHAYALPPPLSSQRMDDLREAVISFRRSAGQYLKSVEEESRSVQTNVSDLSTRLSSLIAEANSQKGRLDAAIAQYQKQYSEAEDRRREEHRKLLTGQTEKSDDTLANFERLMTEMDSKQTQVFQTRMEEFKERAAEQEKALQVGAEAVIAEMEDHRKKAQNLVHVIGNTGMAGGYQKVANNARRRANVWQVIAIVGLVGLVCFAVLAFRATLDKDFLWGNFGARAFVAVTFGILAAYAARQAERQEEVETKSRRYELELASIDPFLVGLPEETQHKVKVNLAERLFGQADSGPFKVTPETSGSIVDLLRLALDTIGKLAKKS